MVRMQQPTPPILPPLDQEQRQRPKGSADCADPCRCEPDVNRFTSLHIWFTTSQPAHAHVGMQGRFPGRCGPIDVLVIGLWGASKQVNGLTYFAI
jgi:hypothetical protein